MLHGWTACACVEHPLISFPELLQDRGGTERGGRVEREEGGREMEREGEITIFHFSIMKDVSIIFSYNINTGIIAFQSKRQRVEDNFMQLKHYCYLIIDIIIDNIYIT